jgi:hypothetical protein
MSKIITFEKNCKYELARMLGYTLTKEELNKLIGFNKKGPIYNIFDLIEQNPT